MRDVRVAAAMMRAVVGDKAGNLERARGLVARAARAGAEIVLLPEACLTGYTVRESMAGWAESVPGPLTEEVGRWAVEFGCVVLAGLAESAPGGSAYLTQVALGPSGLLGFHRKTHLGPPEKDLFVPGRKLTVLDLGGLSAGLQLCYEGHFPEISLAQARQGAEAIFIAHGSPREEPDPKMERWLRYLPARAYDNSLFVLACNQAGDNNAGLTFPGVALILGPKGQVLAQAAAEEQGLVLAELKAADLAAVRQSRMGFFLPHRRPELY